MQMIFKLFKSLSDIPYNIWPWLFFTILPALIFSAKPHHSVKRRSTRIIIAIILGYIALNLSLHTSRTITWNTYERCQSQFSDGAIQHHKECGEMNIADGASYAFAMFLGWIPSIMFVGWLELIWRKLYKNDMQTLRKGMNDDVLANIVVSLSYYFTVGFTVLIVIICLALYGKF